MDSIWYVPIDELKCLYFLRSCHSIFKVLLGGWRSLDFGQLANLTCAKTIQRHPKDVAPPGYVKTLNLIRIWRPWFGGAKVLCNAPALLFVGQPFFFQPNQCFHGLVISVCFFKSKTQLTTWSYMCVLCFFGGPILFWFMLFCLKKRVFFLGPKGCNKSQLLLQAFGLGPLTVLDCLRMVPKPLSPWMMQLGSDQKSRGFLPVLVGLFWLTTATRRRRRRTTRATTNTEFVWSSSYKTMWLVQFFLVRWGEGGSRVLFLLGVG